MSKQQLKFLGLTLAAVGATLFTAAASASIQYSFATSSGSPDWGSNVSGDSFSSLGSGDSGPNVTVSGWSNIGAGSGDSRQLQQANLYMWTGLGVDYGSADAHSTDNAGAYDSVLFSFTDDIELTGLSIGWKETDSDVTVLAYTGAGIPTLSGKTYAQLTQSDGWLLIDHQANLSVGENRAINSGGVSSSYWLVGAYNPLVGNPQNWTLANDFVKISGLAGKLGEVGGNSDGQVPEPASIALLALGLLAIRYVGQRAGARPVRSAPAC